MRTTSHRVILLLILLAALGLRAGWAIYQGSGIDQRLPDQGHYLQIAENLLAGRGMVLHDERYGQDLLAYRMPGYPLFVAALGASPLAVRMAQAGIDVSTVLAVYLLAGRLLVLSRQGQTSRIPLLAAAIVAVNPFLIYFSGLILSETLYTALLIWGVYLLVRYPNFLWGGIVLALSIHVRPSALLLPVVMGFAAVFLHRAAAAPAPRVGGRSFWNLRLPVGSTMLILVLLALVPWAYRNHERVGRWVWLTTNGGISLYDGWQPNATGASDQRFADSAELRPLRLLNEEQRDTAYTRLAVRSVRAMWAADRSHVVDLVGSKLGRTWSPIPLSQDYGSNPLYVIAGAAYALPLFLAALAGLFYAPLPRSAKALLLLPAIYYSVVHALTVGSLRYRVPVEPLLAVLAAVGIAAMFAARKRSTKAHSGDSGDI